jgi:MFS family permease
MSTSNHAAVHAKADSLSPLSPLLPAVMGTLFVLLFLLSCWLVNKAADATRGKNDLLKFYESDQNRLLVIFGLYLAPFAGIAFLWFIASLHEWLIQRAGRQDRLISSMQQGSALLFVALFFCSVAAGAATAISQQFLGTPIPSSETASLLPELGYTLLFVFALRAAALFILMTSRFAQSMNVFPRWLSIVGYLVGIVLMLSVSFSHLLVLLFPLWILLVCGFLFSKARSWSAAGQAQPSPTGA